nr:hypothetical protein [uncultured Flavobacterium sp.]
MKATKFLIILFLFALQGYAQATGFAVISNKVVWENVFVSDQQNISALIARHSRLKVTSTDGKVYKGVGKNIIYKCSDTSATLNKGYSFNFEVELVEGKYRVTITGIVFNTTGKTGKTQADAYFINDGKLKQDTLVVADMTCLEGYFNRIFSTSTTLKNRS